MKDQITILHGDCLLVMPTLAANSIDAIVTDPPYGLGFMGKDWDHGVPGVQFWIEALRVAKPGTHLLAFGGTRKFHRLTVAIEDAGWEIRDCIMWVYGSGFPKSLDVAKAIDKANGVTREDKFEGSFERRAGPTGNKKCEKCGKWLVSGDPCRCPRPQDAAVSPEAQMWQGWGTALKPAWEPIIVARKPLDGTVAANVQKHGTGALNIDGCRIPTDGETLAHGAGGIPCRNREGEPSRERRYTENGGTNFAAKPGPRGGDEKGRWPANVVHDGSDEVVSLFPSEAGACAPVRGTEPSRPAKNVYGEFARGGGAFHGDAGSAARFFYCAKADRADRNEGCEDLPKRDLNWSSGKQSPGTFQSENTDRSATNFHPTVKPTDLMRWLCRLVTPKGGTVLDPFMGSGSTLKAAELEGFKAIGIEINAEYVSIARSRISADAPLFKHAQKGSA